MLRYQGDGQQMGSLTSGAKLTCFLPKNQDLEEAHRMLSPDICFMGYKLAS